MVFNYLVKILLMLGVENLGYKEENEIEKYTKSLFQVDTELT